MKKSRRLHLLKKSRRLHLLKKSRRLHLLKKSRHLLKKSLHLLKKSLHLLKKSLHLRRSDCKALAAAPAKSVALHAPEPSAEQMNRPSAGYPSLTAPHLSSIFPLSFAACMPRERAAHPTACLVFRVMGCHLMVGDPTQQAFRPPTLRHMHIPPCFKSHTLLYPAPAIAPSILLDLCPPEPSLSVSCLPEPVRSHALHSHPVPLSLTPS